MYIHNFKLSMSTILKIKKGISIYSVLEFRVDPYLSPDAKHKVMRSYLNALSH